jgi:hypothetical protein
MGRRARRRGGNGARLSAIFAVALTLLAMLAGAAPSSLPFSDCPVFLNFLDFLDGVTFVTGAFFLPWFCHLLSFCRHRTLPSTVALT